MGSGSLWKEATRRHEQSRRASTGSMCSPGGTTTTSIPTRSSKSWRSVFSPLASHDDAAQKQWDSPYDPLSDEDDDWELEFLLRAGSTADAIDEEPAVDAV